MAPDGCKISRPINSHALIGSITLHRSFSHFHVQMHKSHTSSSACAKHSWQNGIRCRDGVKFLWCHSHLVWLVFEDSIPTCASFHSENVFLRLYYIYIYKHSKLVAPEVNHVSGIGEKKCATLIWFLYHYLNSMT